MLNIADLKHGDVIRVNNYYGMYNGRLNVPNMLKIDLSYGSVSDPCQCKLPVDSEYYLPHSESGMIKTVGIYNGQVLTLHYNKDWIEKYCSRIE
jgi:hypothetical protein